MHLTVAYFLSITFTVRRAKAEHECGIEKLLGVAHIRPFILYNCVLVYMNILQCMESMH